MTIRDLLSSRLVFADGGFGSLLGSLMGGGESQSSGGSIGDLLGSFLSGRSLPELDQLIILLSILRTHNYQIFNKLKHSDRTLFVGHFPNVPCAVFTANIITFGKQTNFFRALEISFQIER